MMDAWIEKHYETNLNVPVQIVRFVQNAHDDVRHQFEAVDKLSEYHQGRILQYMKECQISQRHFYPSNGYGYGDDGRDALDELFSLVFGGGRRIGPPTMGVRNPCYKRLYVCIDKAR